LLAASAGHSLPAIGRTWLWLAGKLLPRSAAQWGVVALVAAFLLLAAGAALSMARGKPEEGEGRGNA
jgi:hypothetical protein